MGAETQQGRAEPRPGQALGHVTGDTHDLRHVRRSRDLGVTCPGVVDDHVTRVWHITREGEVVA